MHWQLIALRGLGSLAFGVVALLLPALAVASLVFLVAAYALLDGVLAIGSVISAARQDRDWSALGAEAVLDMIVALFLLALPAVSVTLVMVITGLWATLSGIALAIASLRLGAGLAPMRLAAAFSTLFGLLLLLAPLQGALVIASWFGIYAILFGILLLALAARLRSNS